MRIYIVHDCPVYWKMLDRVARDAGGEIETFAAVQDFLAATTEGAYSCVLLVVRALSERARDALVALAARVPPWPVVILAETAEVDDAIAAFRLGALHFLHKSSSEADLATALREALEVATARFAEQPRATPVPPVRLSQREREVLGALAEGRQSKVIAWHLGVSVRTIDMHRSNILAKLGARNASQAVSIALDLKLLDSA